MGWLDIPKISTKIPIYHGTSNATLSRGVGHLLGSSLPVGGENTHCVLTAHSGMANNVMFSDLPSLKTGDLFYIHVLDRTLAYRVDQIVTVLPSEMDSLSIEQGHDYCTLITCTPFGVNTHRLLVRGERATINHPIAEEETPVELSPWTAQYLKGIFIGIVIFVFIVLLLFLLWLLKKKRRKDRDE